MAVDAVNAAAANPWANAGASSSDKNAASLNYDSFLKLLIAQMKNQDPTSPMDAGQQMSQLASFSQVEQTIKTNTHLKSMLQAEALTRASDLVGKTVMSLRRQGHRRGQGSAGLFGRRCRHHRSW